MARSKIEIPQLTGEQIQQLQTMYARGETVNAISSKTGIRCPAVWFYAVNKGVPDRLEIAGPCWCGGRHYAKGLCERHYKKVRRASSAQTTRRVSLAL